VHSLGPSLGKVKVRECNAWLSVNAACARGWPAACTPGVHVGVHARRRRSQRKHCPTRRNRRLCPGLARWCAHWVCPGKVRECNAWPSVIVAIARGGPAACTPGVHVGVHARRGRRRRRRQYCPSRCNRRLCPGQGPGVGTIVQKLGV